MRVIVLSAALAALCLPNWAADNVDPADIIRRFAAKELEFQQARNNYTYRQSVMLQEVNGGGSRLGGKMRVIVLSAALAAWCLPNWAADNVDPADIIRRFAAKELEFQQARNNR